MTAPMRITLQIDPFCNCKGCIRKVKKALSKLGDVKLLAMGLDIETFTILTTNHPEEIKYALKHVFPKKNIILSQETDHPYPLHVPHVNDIATALVTMSQVKGLESMEFTQSNTFKFNFTNRHNHSTLSSLLPTLHNIRGYNGNVPPEHAPPPPQTSIRPSAPPILTTPDLVYGYPWPSAPPSPKTRHQVYGYPHPEFYGYNKNHPYGC
ncbi:hypothetical protein L1987_35133 [Smallanthus sonchifolius]|uniref:Uncharacterized protein n=1 Tax=Smallanthus sonchifolius TaxID=185202 RepID=A0ACB9HVM2_9ASTR|nr:hypothetical protein L1987_35133 [Smallanthus sonchifolius]